MAQEAVLIIKRSEEEASEIIAAAEKEALEIIEKAQRESSESKKELIEKLKADFNNAVLKAKSDAQKISTENSLNISAKADDLKKKLIKNKDKAITEVLKKVIEG